MTVALYYFALFVFLPMVVVGLIAWVLGRRVPRLGKVPPAPRGAFLALVILGLIVGGVLGYFTATSGSGAGDFGGFGPAWVTGCASAVLLFLARSRGKASFFQLIALALMLLLGADIGVLFALPELPHTPGQGAFGLAPILVYWVAVGLPALVIAVAVALLVPARGGSFDRVHR